MGGRVRNAVLIGAALALVMSACSTSTSTRAPSTGVAPTAEAAACAQSAIGSPAPSLPPLSTAVAIDRGSTTVALLTAPAPGASGLAYLVACRYEHGASVRATDSTGGTVDDAFAGPLSVDRSIEVSGPPTEHVLAGRLRAPVAAVAVDLSNGTTTEAAVKDGYWIAWWTADATAQTVRGTDASGNAVASAAPR